MNTRRMHLLLPLLFLATPPVSCVSPPSAGKLVKVRSPDDGQEAKLLKETGLVGGVNGEVVGRTAIGMGLESALCVLDSAFNINKTFEIPSAAAHFHGAARTTYGNGIFGWHWHKSDRVALSVSDHKMLKRVVQAARDYNAHVVDYNTTVRHEIATATTGGDKRGLKALQQDASSKLASVEKAIARRKTAVNNLPPAYRGDYSATMKPLLLERDILTNFASHSPPAPSNP